VSSYLELRNVGQLLRGTDIRPAPKGLVINCCETPGGAGFTQPKLALSGALSNRIANPENESS